MPIRKIEIASLPARQKTRQDQQPIPATELAAKIKPAQKRIAVAQPDSFCIPGQRAPPGFAASHVSLPKLNSAETEPAPEHRQSKSISNTTNVCGPKVKGRQQAQTTKPPWWFGL